MLKTSADSHGSQGLISRRHGEKSLQPILKLLNAYKFYKSNITSLPRTRFRNVRNVYVCDLFFMDITSLYA